METESIMERVKTFEDAVDVLGKDHPLVKDYGYYRDSCYANLSTLAHLKVRIITAALNEGWEPKFTEDEFRYYPYFQFYTKDEYDAMDAYERIGLILFRTSADDVAHAGLVSAYLGGVHSITHLGSRLCFKTKELAEYAAKQFIELYYDFYMK